MVQRQVDKEDEETQAKPFSGQINALAQRHLVEKKDAPIQTKRISGGLQTLQRQEEQEEEEQTQTKSFLSDQNLVQGQEVPDDEAVVIKAQRREGPDESAADKIDTTRAERAMARSGTGSPLSLTLQAQMEESFGADFSGVHVHTDTAAYEASEALNARAFTHGSDIYLARGQMSSDLGLMAHELTHVLHQTGKVIGIQRLEEAPLLQSITPVYARSLSEEELERLIYDTRDYLLSTQESSEEAEAQRRNLAILEQEVDLRGIRNVLREQNIVVSEDELAELNSRYPGGIQLESHIFYIVGTGTDFAASSRVAGFRVQTIGDVRSTVTTYILRPGHGRAIVVSSEGGPTVMLDAGAMTRRGRQAVEQGLRALLQAGLTTLPSRFLVSHTDADHINAIRQVMQLTGMSSAAVELTLQQYQNAVGRADYANARIEVQPNLVDINVHGRVHINRRILGNMEITEFRLVSVAQEQADPTRTTGQLRALKNRSSPVTVVRDLIAGGVQVFTADGTGHLINEIVDSVGREAFHRMIGGAGRNLQLSEIGHHAGRIGPGHDAAGWVRFLQLQFEASDGRTRFFTQTGAGFSSQPGASIRVLNDARVGFSVEAITEGPANEIYRARGGELERITVDMGRITQVQQTAQNAETILMAAAAQRHRIKQLLERAEPLKAALSETRGARQLAQSVQEIIRGLNQELERVNQPAQEFFNELAAAGRSRGLRAGEIDLSGVTRAQNRLSNALPSRGEAPARAVDPVERLETSLWVTESMISVQGALIQNAVEMYEALMNGRVRDLPNLKARQRQLIGRATRVLGAREVIEHVRNAWSADGAAWSPANFNRIARRIGNIAVARRTRMTRYQIQLSETLSQALRMREIVERASHGAGGARGMRGRIGAGFLAAIEALRIGLEAWEQYEAASEAEATESENRRIRGRNMVAWWTQRGVFPRIALLDDDNKPVGTDLSLEVRYQIVLGRYAGIPPEFVRVVVTDVTEQERAQAVGQLTIAATTLDDWYQLVEDERYRRHRRGWTPFKRQDGQWYTLVWNLEEEEYQASFSQTIHDDLENLYTTLQQNQQAALEYGRDDTPIYSVEDTALLFGVDRYVYVYNNAGRLERIDFEDRRPRFIKLSYHWPNIRVDFTKTQVEAADAQTYGTLRRYLWPTGDIGVDQYGTTFDFGPNRQGYALVEEGNLKRS